MLRLEISIKEKTGAFLSAFFYVLSNSRMRIHSSLFSSYYSEIPSITPISSIPDSHTTTIIYTLTLPFGLYSPLLDSHSTFPCQFSTCHASHPDGMKSEHYSSSVTETNGREWTMAHFVA
ncbi:hypothetical protein K439DRAFT_369592 [Ramaria rubella]|nr:hypothetical protein K439DRAFT_369592 [Ramaria rubella]